MTSTSGWTPATPRWTSAAASGASPACSRSPPSDVLALDISPEMLERARELNPDANNVEWLLGDGTSLAGVQDASVDACVSQVVLQHVPDSAITLGYVREIGRVLKPGGWAAIQVSNDAEAHRRRAPHRLAPACRPWPCPPRADPPRVAGLVGGPRRSAVGGRGRGTQDRADAGRGHSVLPARAAQEGRDFRLAAQRRPSGRSAERAS